LLSYRHGRHPSRHAPPPLHRSRHTVVAAAASDREKASLLYKAVRDGIRYNPYVDMGVPGTFRASNVLAAGNGYCVG
jgi:transglutaminase-like putative cysteine protease